jgi:phage minor structural protein
MWVYDDNHNKIEFLPYFKDRSIVSVLSTGDKTLSFSYPIEKSENLIEENYIRTESDEYVIKQTKTKDDYLEVIAKLNVEGLEGVTWDNFKTTYKTITEALNLMLVGTGWEVGYCEVTKKRTVEGTYKTAWELSQRCIDTYLCELEYDTLNKRINVYNKRGSYKGVFAIDGVNMDDLEIQSTSYDFYTRLIPVGKDGLSIAGINDGVEYIENYQYSNKVKTCYWKDERYTVVEDLYEDAVIKLDELSQPTKSYSMKIRDLAKINDKYSAYEFKLGDTILLVSKSKHLRLKERIVKYTEYPESPEDNKVEVSTTKITLEDIQKKFKDSANVLDNVTTAGDKINGGSVEGLEYANVKYYIEFGTLNYDSDSTEEISFNFAQTYGNIPVFIPYTSDEGLHVEVTPIRTNLGYYGGKATVTNKNGTRIKSMIAVSAYCALPQTLSEED